MVSGVGTVYDLVVIRCVNRKGWKNIVRTSSDLSRHRKLTWIGYAVISFTAGPEDILVPGELVAKL